MLEFFKLQNFKVKALNKNLFLNYGLYINFNKIHNSSLLNQEIKHYHSKSPVRTVLMKNWFCGVLSVMKTLWGILPNIQLEHCKESS